MQCQHQSEIYVGHPRVEALYSYKQVCYREQEGIFTMWLPLYSKWSWKFPYVLGIGALLQELEEATVLRHQ